MIPYKKFEGTFTFSGKVALITGAANGIGRATAEAFAARGIHLVLLDRQEGVREIATDLVTRFGIETMAAVCDITDNAQSDAVVEQARGRFGRIDILCNIAGVVELEDAENLPPRVAVKSSTWLPRRDWWPSTSMSPTWPAKPR